MTIKIKTDSLEGIPEPIAQYYKEQDGGGFVFSPSFDEQGYGIDNVGRMRADLAKVTADKGRADARFDGLKLEDGSLLTMEMYQANNTLLTDAQKQVATLTDKTKSGDQRLAESISQAKAPLLEKLKGMEGERESFKSQAFDAAKRNLANKIVDELNPQDRWRKHILASVERNIGVEADSNGMASAHIVDPENGGKLFSSTSGAVDALMTIDEFVGGPFKSEFADLLKGDDLGGTGGDRQSGNTNKNTHRAGSKQPMQITRQDSEDLSFYIGMKAKAKEAGVSLQIID